MAEATRGHEERLEILRVAGRSKPEFQAVLERIDRGEEVAETEIEELADRATADLREATKEMMRQRGAPDLEPLRARMEASLEPEIYQQWLETIYADLLEIRKEVLAEQA